MAVKIRNWHKFQHFKDRKPPWIKLYRDILDDILWHELDGEAAKTLVTIWLIASEHEGYLPTNKELAFRLRTTEKSIKSNLSKLSAWMEQDDISVISDISAISPRYQETRLETETETETEKEKEKEKEVLPHWIPVDAWNGFCEMRKKSKSALTERARVLLIGKLLELRDSGQDVGKVLDQSTSNGWKSVYPVKLNGGNGNGKFSAVQYTARKLAEAVDAGASSETVADVHGKIQPVLPGPGNGR